MFSWVAGLLMSIKSSILWQRTVTTPQTIRLNGVGLGLVLLGEMSLVVSSGAPCAALCPSPKTVLLSALELIPCMEPSNERGESSPRSSSGATGWLEFTNPATRMRRGTELSDIGAPRVKPSSGAPSRRASSLIGA